MQYKLLKQMFVSLISAVTDHQRFYALDDNHIAVVRLSGYIGIDAEPDDRVPGICVLRRHVDQRGDDQEINWEAVDLENLPARHLVRFAELRGTVEKWIAGDIDDLPASTVADPLKDEERGGRGRRRRRLS